MNKEEILEMVKKDPLGYLIAQRDFNCNRDAKMVLEAVITQDPKYTTLGMTYDKRHKYPYLCIAAEEDGAFVLMWDVDIQHVAFDTTHEVREFNPNEENLKYIQAATVLINKEVQEFKTKLVNSFIQNVHYGTIDDVYDEFMDHYVKYLETSQKEHDAGYKLNEQYDFDDIDESSSDTLLSIFEKYGTVPSKVHIL